MREHEWLAERFEANRSHLRMVAYRMLGSASEADDAVQEAWLRLSHADVSDVDNLTGWLTTVVGRICLDMLRSRTIRREEPLEPDGYAPVASQDEATDPEHQALIADSVGAAVLLVLETLAPAERIAFVMHDMFAVPFDDIAPIVGRSPAATRQLASRARRRVQGASENPATDVDRHRAVIDAFLTASRNGDLSTLLTLLDPDVVLRADATALQFGARFGATEEVSGAEAVAGHFSGRARAAQLAMVDGEIMAVWAPGGTLRGMLGFTIRDGRIVAMEAIADPERIANVTYRQLDT